jgi:hypothetical protein
VALRNHQPIYRGLGALGAGLIYKAVSMAHALGCKEFLATVQHQNARFFQRLIGLVAAPRSAAGACIDHILFKIKILKNCDRFRLKALPLPGHQVSSVS